MQAQNIDLFWNFGIRKILGYSQRRLGPNKPSFAGLLQPMADADGRLELISRTSSGPRRRLWKPLVQMVLRGNKSKASSGYCWIAIQFGLCLTNQSQNRILDLAC